LEFGITRALCALPPGLQRLIAGGRLRLDGQALASEMNLLLKLSALAGETSVTGYGDVEAARVQHRRATASAAGPPIPMGQVKDLGIPGPGGVIPARLYDRDGAGPEPRPLLVYYHGGGWVIGDLNTHDGLCRFLAAATGALVLSVDYRLAPEHPYPEPVDDARAAFEWAVEHAVELGVDPGRVAVGGDSAGGNMAAVVSRQTRDAGGPQPAMQLLIYPVTDDVETWASRTLFAEGFLLTEGDMDWFRDHYLPDPSIVTDQNVSPFQADDLSNVAPAYVATAGFDPLRDEGEAYAMKMSAAGVPVVLRRHPGLIHGFAQMTAVSRTSRAAMFEAAGALRMGLAASDQQRSLDAIAFPTVSA
jgi:acetyl esterase/lipase